MAWFTTDWFSSHHTVRSAHKSGDVIHFLIVACRISSRLKWYKNYKNRLRLAKVIVENKMSRFLWFSVYVYWTISRKSNLVKTIFLRELTGCLVFAFPVIKLSAQCVSSIGQIIKSVCVSVSQSVSQSVSEFWDPLHISGTVEARNFKFGTEIGHWGF